MTTRTHSQEMDAIYRVDPVLLVGLDARPQTRTTGSGAYPAIGRDPHMVDLPSPDAPLPAVARALGAFADAQRLDPRLIDPEQLRRVALV